MALTDGHPSDVAEAVKEADEAEKRRTPDDMYVNLTIRRVKRSIAERIRGGTCSLGSRSR